jgi:hypothetical protein
VEPYWTNSAFGMPTYQLNYPYDYIGAIDDALRFYLALLIIYFYTSWGFMVYYSLKNRSVKGIFWC